MKFKCTCGNVIDGTIGLGKGLCDLYTADEYIQWIKCICHDLPIREYPDSLSALYCEECNRYYVYINDDVYVYKPLYAKEILHDNYESYHLMNEIEADILITDFTTPQKINQLIESDFKSLPQTRVMNISFAEKTAYIKNLDGSIETYVVEKVIKNT